ncbi:hypothetical protein C8A03DRAFT_45845 [Achaetomium macrosporum]|uniref:Cell wall biogenesis protein Mhp1 n=1 Tax=Achaetomium macrosporum TaxID=79813 RepID=A0AAN7C7D0_9PEZI|nr:hypothetical protein C8A03DRAFT_45845 [Achaetomium macrosporum]
MEHMQSLDVSWMTHGNPKEKVARNATARPRSSSNSGREAPAPDPAPNPPQSPTVSGNQTTLARSNSLRGASADEKRPPATVTPPQRRNSWFSNISSKFSSGGSAAQSPPQANTASPKPAEFSVPKVVPSKNAVLQHASKHEGEGPYTPAPPRSSQTGLLQVLRRLSSSNGNLSPNMKSHNHGLVERRVLNVDRHRERCGISGLDQAKLRRVAFCVDVEIAPMPKYADELGDKDGKGGAKASKEQKKKIKERGEGEALKHPKEVELQKEIDGEIKATGEELPKEPPAKEGTEQSSSSVEQPRASIDNTSEKAAAAAATAAAVEKKKEKKKKSEEERKARKEKKRRQAEANGTIPMELHYDSDSSSSATPPRPGTPKTQAAPTTNPVRIYRRCCQLRETPILRKITEQLMDPANCSAEPGVVEKLDLGGYWMQLTDLITLGDYLAVVPVREVILDNCGLTDEGLRVILAGLLAARKTPHGGRSRRRPVTVPDGLTEQGGVVERLVLKNNKIGPEGWKHICLFIYLCRTLKSLDLSGIQFPRQAVSPVSPNGSPAPPTASSKQQPQGLCQLLSRSLGERLGGSTLSLLSLGQTGLTTEQLGCVIDGVIRCGVKRLGLANNGIDAEGLGHVARFLKTGLCEGLDLGGNDLRDGLATLADALAADNCPLTALSLADCNLTPSSLCKLLPTLARLGRFRFIDLSHNHELFESDPSAVSVLRRYLPKMACLKRIHLADCAMSPEQAIALAEILPEVAGLAHVSFLENPQLVRLATNAKTEETQEEACALFASLLAAARVSTSLVALEIEVPGEQSSDLVKALAKQVVAYCLRNMELAAATAAEAQAEVLAKPEPEYPDVLQRLVGHDIARSSDMDADVDAAPDEDYVIGGTGVVRALAACLKNRGDESRRQSGEFIRDVENGVVHPRAVPSGGKAKETSKHLLLSARKIRLRLQPAIAKARATATDDTQNYYRLIFLDDTLKGIIKRFEDEFPDTRITNSDNNKDNNNDRDSDKSVPASTEEDPRADPAAITLPDSDDNEEEAEDDPTVATTIIKSPSLSRSNSQLSLSSRALAHEEARVLRAGHKFRAGVIGARDDDGPPDLRSEHYALLASGVEMVGADPNHARLLHELLEELGDEELNAEAREKGVVSVFKERRLDVLRRLRAADPAHWDRFVESQEMARANVKLEGVATREREGGSVDEMAVED